ncbi:MAG: hypothetical protein JWL65_5385 [Gammaproteobacteria bacterium]|nr:hypothetical protein [Gammaproteobacteria bacterium]
MDAAAARTLAERSGNSFQCKVANYFRANKWEVLLSPYYVDALTDKTRESDLIVERLFRVPSGFVGPPRSIHLRLFIECKYVPEGAGAVFWMDPMDPMKAQNRVFTHTPFIPNHPRNLEHHYFQTTDLVAKLFASEKKGQGDESDPIYKALNQCINGFIHNQTRASMIGTVPKEITIQIDYPAIVCSSFDQYYWTSVANPVDSTPMQRNFLLEVDYAYVNPRKGVARDYFLVDMVDFSKIDLFVKSIETEMDAAIFFLTPT